MAASPLVLVVGAGAFGGWTALHLARRGARVTLLDAEGPGHDRSSSGGLSRVLRHAYADPLYVEMAARARQQWLDAQEEWGVELFAASGLVWMWTGEGEAERQATVHLADAGIPHHVWSAREMARRYPQVATADLAGVLHEPGAGVLAARRACAAVRDAVRAAGGVCRQGRAAAGPVADGDLLPLATEEGDRLTADAVVFACGSWLGRLLPQVGSRVVATRQTVLFFHAPPTRYRLGQLPVWAERGERFWYGVPAGDLHPFKMADDTPGPPFDPDRPPPGPAPADVSRARRVLRRRFPELAGAALAGSRICPYELTADRGLILDRHPAEPRAWVVGGGSGHGFKHAPVVGEMMAAAILEQAPLPAALALARLPAA